MGEQSFIRSLGNRFKARNLIIVSDDKVQNFNLSRSAQLVGMVASIACVCWVAFSTGSYIAAHSALEQRDTLTHSVEMERIKMQQEFALVKRDLARLGSDNKLDDYAKFILDQYTGNSAEKPDASKLGMVASTNVMERIAFLENELKALQKNNQKLVDTIRERAEGKIADLDQIIASTGLSRDRMTASAGHVNKKLRKVSAGESSDDAEHLHDDAPASDGTSYEDLHGEGGPYIPEDKVSMQEREQEMLASLDAMVKVSEMAESLPLAMPIQGARVMSGVGRRIDPFTRRTAIHEGLDFSGPSGTKILAANEGVVIFSGRAAGYGNMVEIDHGHGLSTRYGHMSRIMVFEGDKVETGQVIGVQGNTGRSTGAHLHYEVRFNDEPLNPQNFLKASKNVLSLR